MNKQPEQPGGLFDQVLRPQTEDQSKPREFKYASPDDGLGWNCPECELNNGWCEGHPRPEPLPVSDSERDSSLRIVMRQEGCLEPVEYLKKPATSEDVEILVEEIKQRNAS